MKDTVDLKLSIAEVNLILTALGEQPYVKVYELIHKIQNEAQRQLNQNPMVSTDSRFETDLSKNEG